MKLKILIFCLLLSSKALFAQLTINLNVSARPPANLSEWALRQDVVRLIVNNQLDNRQVKINVIVKSSDGSEVSSTDLNMASVVTVMRGTNFFNAAVVFPINKQRFAGKFKNSLERTGKLPSDNYQFCVELVDPQTFAPLTQQVCRSFFTASMQLPILIMPADQSSLDILKAQTAITFRWTPLIPQQSSTQYRLQVFEILHYQQAVQALRANQPILDRIIRAQTQFIWQPQGILLNLNNEDSAYSKLDNAVAKGIDMKRNVVQYVWTIQTLDALGNPITIDGNYEGRSEPYVFRIEH